MILVDASVAFKWFKSRDEPYFEKARSLLEQHLNGQMRIMVPVLLFIEIANAFSTKTATKPKAMRTSLRSLYNFGLEVYSESEEDVVTASLLARKNKTSVYDMIYAVIAKKAGVEFITADERFVRKTKFSFVKLLSQYMPAVPA